MHIIQLAIIKIPKIKNYNFSQDLFNSYPQEKKSKSFNSSDIRAYNPYNRPNIQGIRPQNIKLVIK